MFPGLPTPGPNLPRGRLSKKSPRAGKGDRGAPSRSRGAAVGGGRGSAGPQTGGAAGVGSGGRETRGPFREGLQVDLSLRLREARKREGFLAYPAHGEHGVVLASPRGVRQGGGSGQGQTHPSGCGQSGLAYGRGDGGPRRDTPRVLAVGLAGTDAGREVVAANQRGSSQRALRGDRGDRANVAAQMRGVARSSGVDRRPHQLPLVAPDGMRFRILFTRIPYQTSLGMLPLSVKTMRMSLCPRSAVGSNMHGQPPSITVMPRSRPYSVATSETLPAPGPRCIQTCLIPSSAHSRIVSSVISGRVPITTASTPPGIERKS